jgi:predicted RNase H-like nuclease (RuvC/YqgF family)
LTRQVKELTNAKSLAEAERDDLRLSVGKTQEELAASSDKAKTIITLQKELKGSTEKVDDFKKKLSASKEEEQVSGHTDNWSS